MESSPWTKLASHQPQQQHRKRGRGGRSDGRGAAVPPCPQARCGHAALHDRNTGGILILGGYTDELYDDAWSFDPASKTWTPVKQPSAQPSPLPRVSFSATSAPPADPSLTSDASTGFIFGGTDGESALGDMWRFSCEASTLTWCKVEPNTGAASPTPRANAALCAGPRSLLLLHGGEDGDLLSDAWWFDISAQQWSRLAAAAAPQPCARANHALTYSPPCDSFVLFGGLTTAALAESMSRESALDAEAGAPSMLQRSAMAEALQPIQEDADAEPDMAPLNDLWVLSRVEVDDASVPGQWLWSMVLMDDIGPSPRSDTAMAALLDGEGLIFLFGGHGLVELPGSSDVGNEEEGVITMAYLDDLWALDLSARRWLDESALGYPGESPIEGRSGHSLTPCVDQLVLYGGLVGDGYDGAVYAADLGMLRTAAADAVVELETSGSSDAGSDGDDSDDEQLKLDGNSVDGQGVDDELRFTIPPELKSRGVTDYEWTTFMQSLESSVQSQQCSCGGAMEGWLARFNAEVMEPRGMYASTQTSIYDNNKQHEERDPMSETALVVGQPVDNEPIARVRQDAKGVGGGCCVRRPMSRPERLIVPITAARCLSAGAGMNDNLRSAAPMELKERGGAMEAWVARLNADVLEPKGMFAATQTAVWHNLNHYEEARDV
ncbi:hypothetical protein JKP88DRAFT_266775 [Tribonema minus]|uniref:Uncharacterized protein n=1 Tax=Tribonema minus TaxID=303371 RepID=A0A835ZEE3_9STRA|nr:hypothetical protein JKP88DRAFT_266775 [Tribonema minus]